MILDEVAVVYPPRDGVWRIGRRPDPLALPDPLPSYDLDRARIGNRFDSPLGTYSVLYFGTSKQCCFGETLARFRLDPNLVPIIGDEWGRRGFMRPGCVPQEWRDVRKGVRAWFPEEWPFLDVEAFESREFLRRELGELLAYLRYPDLDIGLIRGGDRRVTRWVSQWTYDATDEDGTAIFAGIRYVSRLEDDWECWAVFDDVDIEVRREISIERDDDDLRAVASRYGLRVF